MKNHLAIASIILLTIGASACSTTGPTPVSPQFSATYNVNQVNVKMAGDRSIPKVYDKAVAVLIDSETGSREAVNLQQYIKANGGRGIDDDQLAERYVEYRIGEDIQRTFSSALVGDRPANFDINIEKVSTPNAATMILVGEIKGVRYDMDIIDQQSGQTVIDLTEASSPFVEKSLGAGGGLLGLAMRAGKNTHVSDLEQIIAAVTNEIRTILLGPVTNKTVIKKIRIAPQMESDAILMEVGES